MNRNQFDNKHRNLAIEKAELDRKWRMHLREQEEIEIILEAQRARSTVAVSPSDGGGSAPSPPTPTPTILKYNTTQGPSFEWNGITFTLDTSLPNYSYTATITAIPGTVVQVTGYTNLIGVTIGNTVTSIGVSAFLYCANLTSVTFTPTSTLISIAEQAFGYTGLTSIAIPTSVTSILTNAFYSSQLSTVTIANGQLGINSPDTGVDFFGATVTTVLP